MMTFKSRKIFFIILLVTVFIYKANSQAYYNDAANSYNEGIGLMKTDVQSAIEAFEKSISISTQVGDSALAIKEKATQVLADLYFQKAYKLNATDKKPNEAIQAAKFALDFSKKNNVEKAMEKTEKLLVQLYGITASNFFKEKSFDKAVACYDSALMINPESTSSLFNKAIVLKAQENSDQFGQTIDLFIEKANKANDTAQVSKAQKLAMEYYRVAGNKANTANKLNDAINLLNNSLKYGTNNDVFYALANVYNKQKKYDDALINADKGLTLETSTKPEDKAKFYYEKAVAQAGKGLTQEACESFTNAKFGAFLDASKAQMTNLKCTK